MPSYAGSYSSSWSVSSKRRSSRWPRQVGLQGNARGVSYDLHLVQLHPQPEFLGDTGQRLPALCQAPCQFPLAEPAREGDPLAASLVGDLLRWARPSF
jgi:hypothetical protein